MSESEVKQITGVCSEVSERGEWTTFHVDTGGQWPVKLSTKLQPLIELGRAAKQELAVWTYDESDGKINPNSGQPYKNRYLSKVEVGGAQQASQNGPDANEGPAASRPPVLGGDKDRLIVRQASLKVAGQLYSGRGDPSDEAGDWPLMVMKAAQRFESWVYRDLEPPPFV